MPSSSRVAEDRLSPCFCANSPRMREERSATSCITLARSSGWLISHDAVGAWSALRLAGVVEIVQVRDRLAHGEKDLVGVQRAPVQHAEQVGGALRAVHGLHQLAKARAVMLLELRHAPVRAVEWLAVRG